MQLAELADDQSQMERRRAARLGRIELSSMEDIGCIERPVRNM
jgi:hypothetical protein